MMAGAVSVLNEAGCALVGGHTGEGSELALGFAINGLIDEQPGRRLTKGGMRPGDVLILTKPIGTGTLFAAHKPRLKARGRWIDAALESMQVSNRAALPCLIAHGATACTDLTGFGLLGHLVEMTKPSGVDAELDLECAAAARRRRRMRRGGHPQLAAAGQPAPAARPAQPGRGAGAPELPADLRPANRRRPARQRAGGHGRRLPRRARAAGYPRAARIGRVLAQGEALEPIRLAGGTAVRRLRHVGSTAILQIER
jgi:selenide,water dikinase